MLTVTSRGRGEIEGTEARARNVVGRVMRIIVLGHAESPPTMAVRRFMHSKDATPLIERSSSIQHETAFLAQNKAPQKVRLA